MEQNGFLAHQILRDKPSFAALDEGKDESPSVEVLGSIIEARISEARRRLVGRSTTATVSFANYEGFVQASSTTYPLSEDRFVAGDPNAWSNWKCLVKVKRRTYSVLGYSSTNPIIEIKTGSALELINRIREIRHLPFAAHLADRLAYLAEARTEEYPELDLIVPESILALMLLLSREPHLACPELVLSGSGEVRAEWTLDEGRHFAVDFFNVKSVAFVLFAPHPVYPSLPMRLLGQATADTVMDVARQKGLGNWVFRK